MDNQYAVCFERIMENLIQQKESNTQNTNDAEIIECGESHARTQLKENLRNKIQQRRLPEVQSHGSPHQIRYELTYEERVKVEQRKLRNRQASRKCRIKQEQRLKNLLKDELELETQQTRLKDLITRFTREKIWLTRLLTAHKCKKLHKPSVHSEPSQVKGIIERQQHSREEVSNKSEALSGPTDIKGNLPHNGCEETNQFLGKRCSDNDVCNLKGEDNKILNDTCIMTRDRVVNARNYLINNRKNPNVHQFFRKLQILLNSNKIPKISLCNPDGSKSS